MSKNKLIDVQKIRDSELGVFSARIAAFILLFSFIDATLLCYYIIDCYKHNNFNLTGWGLLILSLDMWFINNVMLKASIYLFGGTNEDKKVINFAGSIINSISDKFKNNENKKEYK